MHQFYVHRLEIWDRTYVVEAETAEEASKMVDAGDVTSDDIQYIREAGNGYEFEPYEFIEDIGPVVAWDNDMAVHYRNDYAEERFDDMREPEINDPYVG